MTSKERFCPCCSCEKEHWDKVHAWSAFEAKKSKIMRELQGKLQQIGKKHKLET